MPYEVPGRETLGEWLNAYKTIAVVGLSDSPERTSYQVSQAMREAGYRIIPVNPKVDTLFGEKAYASLREIPDSEQIEIVNVFRRSEHTPEIAQQAVEINAKLLWLQQGVWNEEAARIAEDAGLPCVMDRCIKVEQALSRYR